MHNREKFYVLFFLIVAQIYFEECFVLQVCLLMLLISLARSAEASTLKCIAKLHAQKNLLFEASNFYNLLKQIESTNAWIDTYRRTDEDLDFSFISLAILD